MSDYEKLTNGPVADYHVHPDYSCDGHGSLDEWCQRAFNIGLSEICFTPHFEANPVCDEVDAYLHINGQREPLSAETIQIFLDDVNRCFTEYGRIGLLVRGGLEFGYYPGWEKQAANIQSKVKLHYRLGGLHSDGDLTYCGKEEAIKLFKRHKLETMADRYFSALDKMVASGLIDCLAHIDIYRKHGYDFYGPAVETVHRGRIEKLFETMLKHDVGYEINTSAIRHGLDEYYPRMEIVNMAREAGVHLIALGSDAHRPEDMALDFDFASSMAYELRPYVDE